MNKPLIDTKLPNHAYLCPALSRLLPHFGLMVLSLGLSLPALSQDNINTSAISNPSNQSDPLLHNLPPELQGTGKWAAFKMLWQQLSETAIRQSPAAPTPDGRQFILIHQPIIQSRWPTVPNYEKRANYLALTPEKATEYRKQLRNIFGHLIESPEAKLLYRLTQLRIDEMSTKIRHSPDYTSIGRGEMLCRAMPPACMTIQPNAFSPTLYLIHAIDRLEARAKALSALRKNATLSDDMYQQSLKAILQEAKLTLYLDIIAGRSYGEPFYAERLSFTSSLKPVHFVKEGEVQSLEEIDLRQINHWEQALLANIKEAKSLIQPVRFGIRTDVTSGIERPPISDEQLNQFLQNLHSFRQALDNLDDLLIALERP